MQQEYVRTYSDLEQSPELIDEARAPLKLTQRTESDRIYSIDLARGWAISLMILSHGVVGLYEFADLSGWALIPVHLATKFSSTLFILIFGMGLALFYGPAINRPDWANKRFQLVYRGFEILVWYKVLTFIQMFQTYERSEIIDALLFIQFPDFVEVLGFYGIFLLWFPFVLRPWLRLPVAVQFGIAILFAAAGVYLNQNYDFGGWTPIKAILVEEKGLFTFGQFQRGALVMVGLALGLIYRNHFIKQPARMSLVFLAGGVAVGSLFYYFAQHNLQESLIQIASNVGKHPPDLNFSAFSLAGAMLLVAAALLTPPAIAKLLRPFTLIGQYPLQAFVFHIFVIFIVYRYLLDLRREVSYPTALALTGLLILLTMIWVWYLSLRPSQKKQRGSAS